MLLPYNYIARARLPRYRKYDIVARTKGKKRAFLALAKAMERGSYKRGDVLGGVNSYAGLYRIVEMVKG